MTPAFAILAMCISTTMNAGSVTIVNRVPAHCLEVLGGPALPVAVVPIQEMAYNDTPEAAGAISAPPKASTPKKAKKRPAASRKQSVKGSTRGCRPGRWRNARGICGRWGR